MEKKNMYYFILMLLSLFVFVKARQYENGPSSSKFVWNTQKSALSIDKVPPLLTAPAHNATLLSTYTHFTRNYRNPKNYPTFNKRARRCRKSKCKLPYCSCGGTKIPGEIPAAHTPQMITITFDDSVERLNYPLFPALFNGNRTNPNGCPIRGTFYVSNAWTDYSLVQKLYNEGHEIASHSIRHLNPGYNSNKTFWSNEIDGQRRILTQEAKIRRRDIRGMRAPFLQPGGNKQFQMLWEKGYFYDSSLSVGENNPPQWPYTFDYAIPHKCVIPPCPVKSFPGLWELPLVDWTDLGGYPCSMADACHFVPTDSETISEFLMRNFRRNYETTRAPFGMYYHASWFLKPQNRAGFIKFLDKVLQLPDVWIVTAFQSLQWIQHPTPLSVINKFKPWSCAIR